MKLMIFLQSHNYLTKLAETQNNLFFMCNYFFAGILTNT